jgi:hypothetical protein
MPPPTRGFCETSVTCTRSPRPSASPRTTSILRSHRLRGPSWWCRS